MNSDNESNGPSSDAGSPLIAVGCVIGGVLLLILIVACSRGRPYYSRRYWHDSRGKHNVVQMTSMNFHNPSHQQAPPPYMPETCPPAHVSHHHHHHHHQTPTIHHHTPTTHHHHLQMV